MSFNKHRHAKYISQSRHHFQNSFSKIGGSAAGDACFVPKYRQKSPEPGGSTAGAYSDYFDHEHESEIEDYGYYQNPVSQQQLISRDQYHHPVSKQYSSHYSHHGDSDHSLEDVSLDYQHQKTYSRDSCYSKSESFSRHRPSSWVYTKSSNPETDHNDNNRSNKSSRRNETPCYRSSKYKDYEQGRSSHISHRSSRKSSFKYSYRQEESCHSKHSISRNNCSARNHSPSDNLGSGRRLSSILVTEKYSDRPERRDLTSSIRRRRQRTPSSSSCSSEDSYSSSSSSGSNCSSVKSYYSSDDDSPSDRHYASTGHHRGHYHEECPPERHYYPHHQQRKSQLLRNSRSKRVSDLNDDYLSLCNSEDQYKTEEKTTRRLKVAQNTPVTFQQEFLHRLDNITCMAKLLLSRSQTPPRTGFRNQPLNWRGLFL